MRNVLFLTALLFPLSALAAGAPNPLGEKRSNAPIEINSDKLDVFQQENRAVFTGHVVAIQEDKRLKSDVMIVYYRKPANEEAKPGGATPAPAEKLSAKPDNKNPGTPAASNDSIKRIDVEGHVLMITPTETASGARGVYDPVGRELRLYENVVLTRGQNTLKGDQLVYNLDSGKSVVTGNGTVQTGPGKQRVHALLMPEHDNKQNDNNKK